MEIAEFFCLRQNRIITQKLQKPQKFSQGSRRGRRRRRSCTSSSESTLPTRCDWRRGCWSSNGQRRRSQVPQRVPRRSPHSRTSDQLCVKVQESDSYQQKTDSCEQCCSEKNGANPFISDRQDQKERIKRQSLYTYRDSLNHGLLESRIKRAGLVSEWKAFGALAIEYLGFPKDSMPLLNDNDDLDANLKRKADRIMEFILKSGNMGHNRESHFSKYPYLIRKCVSMGRRISDLINHARVFPLDSLRFFLRIMFNGVRSAIKGE